jgi:hypothetical protein
MTDILIFSLSLVGMHQLIIFPRGLGRGFERAERYRRALAILEKSYMVPTIP